MSRVDLTGVAAVDVETATGSPSSVCQIGVAAILDGKITSRSWLVKPPGNRYDIKNVGIHGITAEDTVSSPAFPEAWAQAVDFIGGRTVIAHNAEFDMNCINAAMTHYEQPEPAFGSIGCTLRMAHLVWPERTKSYRLTTLSQELGIEQKAHDAGSDAAATLALAQHLAAEWSKGTAVDLIQASNRGWRERSQQAMRRVSRGSTNPPSTRQVDLMKKLLGERGIDDRQVLPLLKTSGQMSRLIDALFEEKRDAHRNDLNYRAKFDKKLRRVIDEG